MILTSGDWSPGVQLEPVVVQVDAKLVFGVVRYFKRATKPTGHAVVVANLSLDVVEWTHVLLNRRLITHFRHVTSHVHGPAISDAHEYVIAALHYMPQ